MDSLIGTKVGVLFALLVATLIFGFLPLIFLIRPTNRTKDIVSYCNSFAGGVFLATFLLHMMPEAAENLEAALEASGTQINFPLSQFLVAIGFFLILVAELVAHRFYHPTEDDHQSRSRQDGETDRLIDGQAGDGGKGTPGGFGRSRSIDTSAEHILHESHESILSSLVFLFALSLHSLFEGMAIGLQDSISGVLEVFLGVVLHKCVIVFSFSLSLLYHKVRPRSLILYVFVLAVMSPVGVSIGIGIPEDTLASQMASGVLQSMAAGTFLFIIFFEILPGELQTHAVKNDTFLKTLMMVAGFGLMTGLQFLDRD